jgi:hypothetical protein
MTVDEARDISSNAPILLKDQRFGLVIRWHWEEKEFGVQPADGGDIIWIPMASVIDLGGSLIEVPRDR